MIDWEQLQALAGNEFGSTPSRGIQFVGIRDPVDSRRALDMLFIITLAKSLPLKSQDYLLLEYFGIFNTEFI